MSLLRQVVSIELKAVNHIVAIHQKKVERLPSGNRNFGAYSQSNAQKYAPQPKMNGRGYPAEGSKDGARGNKHQCYSGTMMVPGKKPVDESDLHTDNKNKIEQTMYSRRRTTPVNLKKNGAVLKKGITSTAVAS
ncbi:hypothetical protein BCR42DRAFT_444735 [Absidia repens]|uniref:Uncharacterized protein n=1 Tax=Absidia repens TaxID=90262 RepID=A0A1X2HDX2_9FUNG|nr:hypothetical protein BCR42DRAFT_444735 [Absidia repens]